MKPWGRGKPYAKVTDKAGYVRIFIPDRDPFCQGSPGSRKRYGGVWMREHRWVAAKKLGRKLRKGETVHHKNGRRADNRPRNLEVWTGHHGAGARLDDVVAQWLEDTPRAKVRKILLASRHARMARPAPISGRKASSALRGADRG